MVTDFFVVVFVLFHSLSAFIRVNPWLLFFAADEHGWTRIFLYWLLVVGY